jgi:hypothetical protein
MRTTVTLRDDAYEVASAIARSKKKSLGDFLSDLVLGDPSLPERSEKIQIDAKGFPSVRGDRPLTVEMVKALLDEDDD